MAEGSRAKTAEDFRHGATLREQVTRTGHAQVGHRSWANAGQGCRPGRVPTGPSSGRLEPVIPAPA